MRTIWKFPLEVTDSQRIQMPRHSTLRAVGVQNGRPVLWAEVLDDADPVDRLVITCGTGGELEPGSYVGTYQLDFAHGNFVGHVYDGGEV